MGDTNNDKTGDYEVGYGKPPEHRRFQPGQSGNPRGRSKGSRGLRTDLHGELKNQLTIQFNGRPVRGTTQQLMLKTLAAPAPPQATSRQPPCCCH